MRPVVAQLRQIRPIAVVVSWVVDIGGSSLFGLLFFVTALATGRLAVADLATQEAAERSIVASADLYAASLAGGVLFSVVAGYVAARMAGRAELLHGLLSSAACLGLEFSSVDSLQALPAWLVIATLPMSPLAGLLGGYTVRRTRLRTPRTA